MQGFRETRENKQRFCWFTFRLLGIQSAQLPQESAGWMLSEVTKDEASLATAGGDDMG